MKTFFASMLGTLAALLLMVVGGGMMMIVLLVAAASFGESPVATVTPGSHLVFDLRNNITDAPTQFDDNFLAIALAGDDAPGQLQHRLVIRALHEAAVDDRIAGVVIMGSFTPSGYGTSYGSLVEIRRALAAIKEQGKLIRAYLEYSDLRDFYVASVADEISLDPTGMLLVPGLASQPTFYQGLFERFGIGVQVARAGKYKSAIEPYTRRDLSPENREQLQVILDDLWVSMRNSIADSRGIAPRKFQEMVDAGEVFLASDVLAAGLVDRLAYVDEFLDDMKAATDQGWSGAPFRQISLSRYISQIDPAAPGPAERPEESGDQLGQIAVVYAEGEIVFGHGRLNQVGGRRYAREIRQLRQNPSIKALVLRVNSPGGSAMASEQIQRELRLAAEKMPVVVSMGGYAASGGYWISAYGDRVFAEPTTITGSIGVYGMLLNIQELGHDLGLTWDTVKTGQFADAISIARPKTPQELALFQRSVGQTYEDFIARVADGRAMDEAMVREIAEGRVWSGLAAQELGLVDELGGISDAIAYAAEAAGLSGDFNLTEFPRKRELAEVLTEAMNRLQSRIWTPGWVGRLNQQMVSVLDELQMFDDPRGIYARMPLEMKLP